MVNEILERFLTVSRGCECDSDQVEIYSLRQRAEDVPNYPFLRLLYVHEASFDSYITRALL
jgi:hypothetical protein